MIPRIRLSSFVILTAKFDRTVRTAALSLFLGSLLATSACIAGSKDADDAKQVEEAKKNVARGIADAKQFQEAKKLIDQRRFTEAEKLLTDELPSVIEIFGDKHYNVSSVLNLLGIVYLAEGKYIDAEHTFRRALVISDLYDYDTIESSQILMNLANALNSEGRSAEAEPNIRHVIEVLERTTPIDDSLIGKGYGVLCNIYMSREDFLGAVPYCENAIAYDRKAAANGKTSQYTLVISLSNLAGVYSKLHRFKASESVFVEAKHLAKASGVENIKSVVGINEAVEFLE